MAIELGTAYISLVPDTRNFARDVQAALNGVSNQADKAGTDMGSRLASSASKSLRDGWKPGDDIMKGIPNTRLDKIGANIGSVIGKGIGAGIKVGIGGAATAATAAVAGLGYTLTKGFQRLENIDQARFKLGALGHSAAEVQSIMDSALASVKGTAFGLDAAATAAASAVAAGIKPGQQLTKYLTEVGDSAAIAGTSFEDMAAIFNKIQTSNKAFTDDLNQLSDRGLPIFKWLQEEYGVTAGALSKMVENGEVDAQHFQEAIETHIGGAATKMGQSFSGAVDNMEASVARLGANFISAALGGNAGGSALDGPTAAITNLTTKFDQLGGWVNSHQGEIHGFFTDAKNVAVEVGGAVKDISTFLVENKTAAEALAAVFVGWKVTSAITGAATAAKGVATALGMIGPAATTAGAEATAALSAITAPAWLISFLAGGSVAASNALNNWSNAHPEVQRRDPVTGRTIPGRESQGGGSDSDTYEPAPGGLGGGANAQRQRRGLDPIDPTGGLLGGTVAPAAATGKQGIANMIVQSALNRGYSIDEARSILAYSIGESGLNPGISGGVQGDDEVIGLFQQKSGFARAGGINPSLRSDPQSNINAYLNQLAQHRGAGDMAHQLYATSVGGPFYTGGYPAMKSLEAQAQQYIAKMGYDSGGILPPGLTLANNQTGKPEAVFTGKQLADMRTQGAIPAGAGSQGKAGDSTIAKAIGIGGEVINGLIDQAASAASSAASMGVNAVAPGAGGAAGAAAQFGIGMATNAAKRGVKWGTDELGILADSVLQQFTPFGMPRWLSTDPKGFMPQWDPQGALGNLMTAGTQAAMGNGVDPNTTQHGTGMGAAPGPQGPPELFANQANSFLSTAPLNAEAPMPGTQQPAVHMENVYTSSNEELARETVKRQQLAAMQYTGRPTGR